MTDFDGSQQGRSTAHPERIDATPADGARRVDGYGRAFLEAAGHLTDPETVETAYAAGCTVEHLACTDGPVRLAYLEVPMAAVPATTVPRIAAALRRRTRLEYAWFVDPETDAVRVFRTTRRGGPFRYDPDRGSAVADRQRARLERARTDLDALFDRDDLLERFVDGIETHRLALARAIEADTGTDDGDDEDEDGGSTRPPRSPRFVAQQLLSRLCCCYVLVERGLIGLVDDAGAVVPAESGPLFDRLVRETDDFARLLCRIAAGLASDRCDELVVTDSIRLSTPTVAPGLFESLPLEAAAETRRGSESTIDVGAFDWAAVVDDFGAYEWRLEPSGDDRPTAETADAGDPTDVPSELVATGDGRRDPAATITPTELGAAFEAVAVDAGDSVGDGSAAGEREPGPGAGTTAGSANSSDVGAYYTDETITEFMVRRALWEALREKLEAGIEAGATPSALESDALYRPADERRAALEATQRDGFDALFERYADDREVLAHVDATLRALTVCDPAVGTGAFALTVANTLFEWRAMCRPDADPLALRREVLERSVFGVDLLAGTTAVCRLRLWLWLCESLSLETEPCEWAVEERPARPSVPPFPDLGNRVRSGNSLLGVVDADEVAAAPNEVAAGSGDSPPTDRLREYAAAVRSARAAGGPSASAARAPLEARYEELRTDLDARYARSRRDPTTGDPLRVPDRVTTPTAAARSLAVGSPEASTLCVEVPDGIPPALETDLEDLGCTSYTYTARHESPVSGCDRPRLEALFDRLETHHGDGEDGGDGKNAGDDEWTVRVEREYAGRDVRSPELDAFHWPLEFPRPVCEDGGFDVIVSNPPYGASVPPAAKPLLTSSSAYECQAASDTCEWFYERALDLARPGGVVAVLVPKSVAFYRSWADIRETLLERTAFAHVLDVGLGFEGVTLETIAIVQTLVDGHETETSPAPTIHRSRDPRDPTANRPVHLGWVEQRFMRDGGTILFRPIDDDEATVLRQVIAADRRLEDVVSGEVTRQLYVPDREKAALERGSDPYIDAVPWVRPYHLADVRHVDLSAYRDAVETYAVPRVMLKVVRGSRLRAWLDPRGELVGTEKLVNAPLADRSPREIAFVYAALNHPLASFYLQKTIFSETTETARVMDGHYSRSIPIPAPDPELESAVARLAWSLTLARQCAHDTDAQLTDEIDVLRDALEAAVACCYLNHETECRSWLRDLERDGPSESTVRALFEGFYAERFATSDAVPAARWTEIRHLIETVVALVSTWETGRVLESRAMAVVTDVLE